MPAVRGPRLQLDSELESEKNKINLVRMKKIQCNNKSLVISPNLMSKLKDSTRRYTLTLLKYLDMGERHWCIVLLRRTNKKCCHFEL